MQITHRIHGRGNVAGTLQANFTYTCPNKTLKT